MEHVYTDEELIEFKEQLRQYKEIGAAKVISILRRLMQTKITVASLRTTKIAQSVKSLSVISNFDDVKDMQNVNDLASKIITKWKKVAEVEKTQITPDKTQQFSQITQQQHILSTKRLQNNQYNTSVNEVTLDKEEPVFTEGQRELPTYKSNTRGFAVSALLKTFKKVSSEVNVSDLEWVRLVVQLERCILMRSQQAITYKSNVKEVLSMFSSPEITVEVISRLLNKELLFSDVAQAKSTVFLTESQRAAIQKQQEEQLAVNDPQFYNNIRRNRLQGLEGEKCKGCKNQTAFLVKELQTRSSDEPMTRFMECNSCGKSWRD